MRVIGILMMVVLTLNVALAQEVDRDSYVKNGKLIEATLYHDNGVVAQTGSYNLDNKLDGKWMSYDQFGELVSVAYYENGQKVGTWKFYQGDILKEVSYTNAKIAEVKTWKMQDSRIVAY